MKLRPVSIVFVCLMIVALVSSACAPAATPVPTQPPAPAAEPKQQVLRPATTTSTAESGLLDAILPEFLSKYNARVDVIAVGTGQALEIGAEGDADVVLVHSRKGEDQFVADGPDKERFDVMYNDFIVVGPKGDPAKVTGLCTGKEAFKTAAILRSSG